MITKLFGLIPNTYRALYSLPVSRISRPPQAPQLKNLLHTLPSPSGTKPPRFFARGALEKDRKKSPAPIFQLLTESEEKPLLRPIPRNRHLLQTYGKGKGTLKRNALNHVYLDIDDQFIHSLTPYLRSQGLVRAPYFNLFDSPDGAHITTIPSREFFFQSLTPLPEEGLSFSFEIEGLYSLTAPASWPEVDEVWFFKVHSPELEQLRRRHFLPPRPNGHSFLIALAVKPAKTTRKQTVTHRINPSIHAA